MQDTKERIMSVSLKLFARDGYEAVSVRTIAGQLGITQAALYKHYKNKRDIFDSIVARMYQIDAERAKQFDVPVETYDKTPLAYRNASAEKVRAFIEAQFRFWTENEFACSFRRMLILEQYRDSEMAELYQICLVAGVVGYMEDLFREMMTDGSMRKGDTKLLAVEFYAPMFLLISMADSSPDKGALAELLLAHIEDFFKANELIRER
jgi:AcrR family transcriptional regulator